MVTERQRSFKRALDAGTSFVLRNVSDLCRRNARTPGLKRFPRVTKYGGTRVHFYSRKLQLCRETESEIWDGLSCLRRVCGARTRRLNHNRVLRFTSRPLGRRDLTFDQRRVFILSIVQAWRGEAAVNTGSLSVYPLLSVPGQGGGGGGDHLFAVSLFFNVKYTRFQIQERYLSRTLSGYADEMKWTAMLPDEDNLKWRPQNITSRIFTANKAAMRSMRSMRNK